MLCSWACNIFMQLKKKKDGNTGKKNCIVPFDTEYKYNINLKLLSNFKNWRYLRRASGQALVYTAMLCPSIVGMNKQSQNPCISHLGMGPRHSSPIPKWDIICPEVTVLTHLWSVCSNLVYFDCKPLAARNICGMQDFSLTKA